MLIDEKWIPNVGDHYKIVAWNSKLGFHTSDCVWEDDNADRDRLEHGNVFHYVSDAQCWCNAFEQCTQSCRHAMKERNSQIKDSDEWVSIAERLPDKLGKTEYSYQVMFTDGKNIFTGVYDFKLNIWSPNEILLAKCLRSYPEFSKTITHWRPYPQLP